MKARGKLHRRAFRMPAWLALLLVLPWSAPPAAAETIIVELEIDGAIGVATSDYLVSGIDHAEDIGAELVIINMDTPGGLMKPMREIVQRILASTVPVAVYVTPAGARADSAGTYILLASHIAAMNPTSHLGAATPVPLMDAAPEGEDDKESTTSASDRKVMNDAISYIRSLAERHGRNADWAESAVTEAATLTAAEALEQNVIEFVASDRAELLESLNGYSVEVAGESRSLSTAVARVEVYEPNWRIRLLTVISNPEIVLLLGLIGLYGLMYEGWNPGAIVPGVVGAICLLLAAYALQVIPVNYAGLALIIVGVALMVAEAYAPSFGALGLGGITAFIFGAIIMFDSGVPGFGISYAFVAALGVVFAVVLIWLMGYILRLRRRGAVSGRESIVGATAVALEDFATTGKVWLEGEAWHARSAQPVTKDEELIVTRLDGLTLDVERAQPPDTTTRE